MKFYILAAIPILLLSVYWYTTYEELNCSSLGPEWYQSSNLYSSLNLKLAPNPEILLQIDHNWSYSFHESNNISISCNNNSSTFYHTRYKYLSNSNQFIVCSADYGGNWLIVRLNIHKEDHCKIKFPVISKVLINNNERSIGIIGSNVIHNTLISDRYYSNNFPQLIRVQGLVRIYNKPNTQGTLNIKFHEYVNIGAENDYSKLPIIKDTYYTPKTALTQWLTQEWTSSTIHKWDFDRYDVYLENGTYNFIFPTNITVFIEVDNYNITANITRRTNLRVKGRAVISEYGKRDNIDGYVYYTNFNEFGDESDPATRIYSNGTIEIVY